jgi:pyruvate/2-oxoglutarate dehydrogenase complex dihydrolipoamide dehydrogenase (E3) component
VTATAAPPRLGPDDVHNRRLLANVHPPGWTNPDPARRYHLVVLGAGTAGLVAAAGAAALGARVALVERHLMGGDCLNAGCIPSKSVIRASRAAAELRDAAALGVKVAGAIEVDFAAVMERVRRVRAELSGQDSAWRFSRELGVDVFLGHGAFTGPDTIAVGGRTLRFARAVVATGARPSRPDVPGLAAAGALTNETVFDLTARPGHLAVVGGGPVGCELAQGLRRLGSEVTLLHRGPRLLSRADPDAAALLEATFAREGIRVLLGAELTAVTRAGDARVLHYRSGEGAGAVTADAVLLAAGRTPNLEGLGLEVAGIRATPAGVVVDDRLRTTNPHVYAAGDVCSERRFTHAADAAARLVVRNALFGLAGRGRASALVVPWCLYTDPEIAQVGLGAREAGARGPGVETFVRHLRDVDRAVTDGETDGFVKVHVRRGSGRILGATIVARQAGEMIGELTLAMSAGIGLDALAGVIHPYPTRADAIRQAADQYRRTRLTPRVRAVLAAWLRWAR